MWIFVPRVYYLPICLKTKTNHHPDWKSPGRLRTITLKIIVFNVNQLTFTAINWKLKTTFVGIIVPVLVKWGLFKIIITSLIIVFPEDPPGLYLAPDIKHGTKIRVLTFSSTCRRSNSWNKSSITSHMLM